MSAEEYLVTFGYGAQDGYYYGPNGKVGKYHRGNDRPTPVGVPVRAGGVIIGLTGATPGYPFVSGPHLHTQACTAGSNYADDFDPSPFEFKFGTVVKAGWHNQFGNHVVVRTKGVDLTYAHLSKINVSVGQIIGGELAMTPEVQAALDDIKNHLLGFVKEYNEKNEDMKRHIMALQDLVHQLKK